MSAGWIAASVRARAMARRRLGLVGVRRLRAAGSLAGAQALLDGTAYAAASGAGDLAAAQRAVADAVLWQVRVLAGWMPSGGTRIARAVVAGFERENLADHLRRISAAPGDPVPEPFDLGSLSTVWNRARTTATPAALREELTASAWGEVPVDDVAAFRDATAAGWLRRLAVDLPGVRSLAVGAAVLLVARSLLLEGRPPAPGAVAELEGLLGPGWSAATGPEQLRAALDPSARRVLDGVTSVDRLWSAEVALWQHVADTGARLLREPLAGPGHVTGAIAVLAADAFRVRAALADAATGGGGEVLGEVV